MATLVALMSLVVMAPGAQAVGTVDQSQTSGGTCISTHLAQTFTAGRTGKLDQVELQFQNFAPAGTVTVELRPVDNGGGPTGTILASSALPTGAIVSNAWTSFTFATPYTVQAGTKYAIVIVPTVPGILPCLGQPNPYAGGTALSTQTLPPTTFAAEPTRDLMFRTYVEPHEFSVDPGSHDFGSQTVGTTTPQAKVFTASNDGATPVVVSGVTITGATTQFHIRGDTCSGETLSSGETCIVMVDFTPISTGAKSATLVFAHNAATGGPTNVPLSGTGTAVPAADGDKDGVPDATDNCPNVANADQADADGDKVGNVCDSTPDGPIPGPVLKCSGLAVTMVGTDGADRIRGTAGVDVISALGGNDRILGLGGDDIVCGGDGDDLIRGGNGDDRLKGNAGNDQLRGGPGDDRLIGGAGDDRHRQ